jgi:hypothetical protein
MDSAYGIREDLRSRGVLPVGVRRAWPIGRARIREFRRFTPVSPRSRKAYGLLSTATSLLPDFRSLPEDQPWNPEIRTMGLYFDPISLVFS